MKFSPYSLGHGPRALPIWQTILEDLGHPHPQAVARFLGIGVRTVYRYNRDGQAPRTVCLALFWLTRWGHSEVHTQAVNACQIAVGLAQGLETEVRQLRDELARVLALSDTGAANEPLIRHPAVTGRREQFPTDPQEVHL